MKKLISLFLSLPLFVSLSACSKTIKRVNLTFIQHTFIDFSYDEHDENNGYYFENDELAKTNFQYDKDYNLTCDDISDFNALSLNYVVPELNGDGYWSFTIFTTSFDESSGLSNNFLKPCKLTNDMTIHFAIYG